MDKLSVVIITFNEEKNIGRCILSVKAIADEIIVVDSFSTDNTRAICMEHQVRFVEHNFEGYGMQKNIALGLASNDFVLSLDADEALDDSLIASIKNIRQQGFKSAAYSMNRRTNYCGRWILHGSWYPDTKVRLFNRNKIQWNNDRIHEKPVIPPGVEVIHLTGDILHYSYTSIDEHVQQNNRFSTISAQAMFSNGKKTSLAKILFNPCWAFVSSYLIRAGFMDGFFGYVIAVNIAHLTFLKHIKLYQLQKKGVG